MAHENVNDVAVDRQNLENRSIIFSQQISIEWSKRAKRCGDEP